MKRNTNCLKGVRCPQCGNQEVFWITATCKAKVTDTGVIDSTAYEWNDDALCRCPLCETTGILSDFDSRTTKQKRPWWDELEMGEDGTFRLIFQSEGEPYITEWYLRVGKQTYEQAAREVCRQFGWNKKRPGS